MMTKMTALPIPINLSLVTLSMIILCIHCLTELPFSIQRGQTVNISVSCANWPPCCLNITWSDLRTTQICLPRGHPKVFHMKTIRLILIHHTGGGSVLIVFAVWNTECQQCCFKQCQQCCGITWGLLSGPKFQTEPVLCQYMQNEQSSPISNAKWWGGEPWPENKER